MSECCYIWLLSSTQKLIFCFFRFAFLPPNSKQYRFLRIFTTEICWLINQAFNQFDEFFQLTEKYLYKISSTKYQVTVMKSEKYFRQFIAIEKFNRNINNKYLNWVSFIICVCFVIVNEIMIGVEGAKKGGESMIYCSAHDAWLHRTFFSLKVYLIINAAVESERKWDGKNWGHEMYYSGHSIQL